MWPSSGIAHRREHDEGHGRGVEHRLEAAARLLERGLRARPLDEDRGLARADVGERALALGGGARRVEVDRERAENVAARADQRRAVDRAETLVARERAQALEAQRHVGLEARIDLRLGVGKDDTLAPQAGQAAGAVRGLQAFQSCKGVTIEAEAGLDAHRLRLRLEHRDEAASRIVEVRDGGQDHLQLFLQRGGFQQPAAQLVEPVQVGDLLAQLRLRPIEQRVDGLALGDVDAGPAQAHGPPAGPHDVHAQQQAARRAVRERQVHLALVRAGAFVQLLREDGPALEQALGGRRAMKSAIGIGAPDVGSPTSAARVGESHAVCARRSRSKTPMSVSSTARSRRRSAVDARAVDRRKPAPTNDSSRATIT
jgi:hypothetical protein